MAKLRQSKLTKNIVPHPACTVIHRHPDGLGGSRTGIIKQRNPLLLSFNYGFYGVSNQFEMTDTWTIDMPNATSISSIVGIYAPAKNLEITAPNAVISGQSMFTNAYDIVSVKMDLKEITAVTAMFSGCYNLERVELGNLTTFSLVTAMFLNCARLYHLRFTGSFPKLTNGLMFAQRCIFDKKTLLHVLDILGKSVTSYSASFYVGGAWEYQYDIEVQAAMAKFPARLMMTWNYPPAELERKVYADPVIRA